MDQFNLLDCTLRDGGYITNWNFGDHVIRGLLKGLVKANLDFIECGYLNRKEHTPGTAVFQTIEQIEPLLPAHGGRAMFLAMADVTQFFPEDITPYTGRSIEGIRVVFYKHQTAEALKLCKAVWENGYKLFVQPMVTMDYTPPEYTALLEEISALHPYAVAVVDTFGCMSPGDFRKYFMILDQMLQRDIIIGFHSHNNMQLSLAIAQDILTYDTERILAIDASLYGMGRGAGNLNTELIAHGYNHILFEKYNLTQITGLISEYIMPITREKTWGYDAYFYWTALYQCHPNYASYLLEAHSISVEDFQKYAKYIPRDMRAKCRRDFVEQLYQTLCADGRLSPRISVVTVCRNAADYIERTMRSVLNQTYKNIEYIIVDGLSSDSTNEAIKRIVAQYPRSQIRHISEPDSGIYHAMNKGVTMASGDFMIFMNAGDIFRGEDVIEKVFVCRDVLDADVAYGDTALVGRDFIREVKAQQAERIMHDIRMPFCHQSAFIRADVLRKYRYDTRYRQAGDHDLFLRLFLADKRFIHVPMVVSHYLLGGISERNNLLQLREKIRIRESNEVYHYSTIQKFRMMANNRGRYFLKKLLPYPLRRTAMVYIHSIEGSKGTIFRNIILNILRFYDSNSIYAGEREKIVCEEEISW